MRRACRGYYDNIRKCYVRDTLIEPLTEAFGCSQNAFQRLRLEDNNNENSENKQKQAETVIDILLDRLFGWSYLDPQTGECRQTVDPLLGIPQGPALSAYAANVLLFPLDRQVSLYVNQINSVCADGKIRVRYARYVDDMVILASDPSVLSHLEEMIHTYLRAIGLELSPKTDHANAVDKEDAQWWLLDERGGLGVSGTQLAPEDTLNELWGYGYDPLMVDRHDALNILKGAVDILAAPPERFDEAFTACFRTENIRYRDVCRLAAFLLEHLLTSNKLTGNLYDAFSAKWQQEQQQMGVARSILSRKDVEPLAFFDGLLILLQRKISTTLPAGEQAQRQCVRQKAVQHIIEGKSIQQAEDMYQGTEGKNTAFLQVKVLQLKALAQVSVWDQKNGTQKGQYWTYKQQKEFSPGLERYLQRWQYMVFAAQSAPVLNEKPPFFRDFPADQFDDFQLFHYLTSCLGCCTEILWFQELRSLFLDHIRLEFDDVPKIRKIEWIWFLSDKTDEKTNNFISPEDASLALQTLSNFLQRDYLPQVVSENPAMRAMLFSSANELNYLPVPPIPGQESCYPGIFALSTTDAYRADFITCQTPKYVHEVNLPWSQLSNPDPKHWATYCAKLENGPWNALLSPLDRSIVPWTPLLVAKIADLYEGLRLFLKHSAPILSKYHLFLDEGGNIHALTYYHNSRTEPFGVALAGPSRFLKWTPIDEGPGKADRAAALLLEDILNLRQYAAEKGITGNLLEVLSYGLRRLTGHQMQAYLSDLSENSFDQTVKRTLDTWRLFAKAPLEQERYVLLEVALTDCLMATRLDWNHSEFMPGEDSAFLERWVITAIQTELPRLSEVLPELPVAHSVEFPMRRSVAAWRDIGCRLLQMKGTDFDVIHALGSSALLRAVCLDIRIRVLECVWAMNDDEMQRIKTYSLPLSLLQKQAEHAVLLFGNEISQQEQANRLCDLMARYQSRQGNRQLEQITPAGWYLLLAWVLELDGSDVLPQRLHPESWEDCGAEARTIWEEAGALLFPQVSDSADTPFPYSGLKPLLTKCQSADHILRRLHRLDEILNFEICRKCADTLSFGRGSQVKTQISIQLEFATRLTVPPQFVSVLHDGTHMPEYEGTNEERVWTQTMLGDQVLSVSTVTKGAADLAWGESCPLWTREDAGSFILGESGETTCSAPECTSAEPTISAELSEPSGPEPTVTCQTVTETQTTPEPTIPEQSIAEALPIQDSSNPSEDIAPDSSFRNRLKNFQKAQQHSWTSRQNLNGNVDRIAFFQFDVDDSYVHPLAECCTEQKNIPSFQKFKRNPVLWDCVQAKKHRYQLYSCSEYRRRKLLEAAFAVCDQFKVDILLMPEYSVRMETVQWMLETIKKCQYKFSVWAGTCRLAPGRKYESVALKELNQQSEDCKAILPIICTEPALPYEWHSKREYPLLHLKRSKKYPSISMEELINPHDRKLVPVMKDPEQLGGRLYGDARDDVMELICAEVFLASNPGNMTAFAQIYDMLQKRFFGISAGIQKQMECVMVDLQTIGEHTSLVQMKRSYPKSTGTAGEGLGKYGRTPILLVPAYTTRTVDYYITGQAAFLATGLTTVFCNAVGLSSRGESCFIGTDCWERNDVEKSPFMPDYSPYQGALPGVYRQYDTKAGHGALGKDEQALVICDVNPLAASGSRPKPESMLQPLTLVAHLPIIESVIYRKATERESGMKCGPYDQCRCSRRRGKETRDTDPEDAVVQALSCLFAILDKFNSQQKNSRTTSYDWEPNKLADALEKLGIELKSHGLKERAKCYRRFHKVNPQALPPATLLDWIWVDLDFPETEDREKATFLNVPEFTEAEFQEPNW